MPPHKSRRSCSEKFFLNSIRVRLITSDADESSDITDPRQLVEELSLRKGLAVRDRLLAEGRDLTDTVIISSDTVVAIDGEILGKPQDADDARRMLRMLSGRSHEVVSGVALIGDGKAGASHEVTEVEFDEWDDETVERYISVARPYDKAGAYAIQGLASAWIKGICGCYFNVVGLPIHRLNLLYRTLFDKKLL